MDIAIGLCPQTAAGTKPTAQLAVDRTETAVRTVAGTLHALVPWALAEDA